MIREAPALQRWILTSNPENKEVWPGKTYSKFEKELQGFSSEITTPIYRGTKFPWIQARRPTLRNKKDLDRLTEAFLTEFDSRAPFILLSTTSFTILRKSAEKFASEAKGFELKKGITMDQGYIHIVEPGIQGVDVYKEAKKQSFIELPETDELLVAKKEQEVLLPIGTVLLPKSRTGRVFRWTHP